MNQQQKIKALLEELLVVLSEEETEAKASAKKLSKAENKSRYAKLNAQLGVASKASKKGDDQKVALALAKAMELASKPTVWQKDVNRILSKAEEYGLSLS